MRRRRKEEEEELSFYRTIPAEHTFKMRRRDLAAVHGTVWHRNLKLIARQEEGACILEAYHAAHCLLHREDIQSGCLDGIPASMQEAPRTRSIAEEGQRFIPVVARMSAMYCETDTLPTERQHGTPPTCRSYCNSLCNTGHAVESALAHKGNNRKHQRQRTPRQRSSFSFRRTGIHHSSFE